RKMREWMISNSIATEADLDALDKTIKKEVRDGKKAAWDAYLQPILAEQKEAIQVLTNLANSSENKVFIERIVDELKNTAEPIRKDIAAAIRKSLRYVINENSAEKDALTSWT